MNHVADLERDGYVLRVREPAHRMLRTPERDVHIHVCASRSAWEIRHLLFRDWRRPRGTLTVGCTGFLRAVSRAASLI